MDEATTGLDRDYRLALLQWLEGYLARGGRMIWCSHDPQELDRLCGDRIRIRQGHIER
jgi:ABC-type multidrug transport system ATPase subunit